MTDRGVSVVVDTGIFSDALAPSRDDLASLYREDLDGKKLLISFQTAAEIRYGALSCGWGVRRLAQMERHLDSVVEVPPHAELTKLWAVFRHDCQTVGHAFHQKLHAADLWIAATARLIDAPLVTHDTGFRDLPGLEVICRV